ncbi:MAG: hypothetical protein ACM3SR_08630 [Ignavibacteriales bacterium]
MSKKISEKYSQEEKTDTSQTRKPFTEPRLVSVKPKFIQPKLTKYENVAGVTFSGAFSPTK